MSNVVKLAEAKEVVKNTYTFTMLVEAKLANPNGDPDAGNMPRIDPESGKSRSTSGSSTLERNGSGF